MSEGGLGEGGAGCGTKYCSQLLGEMGGEAMAIGVSGRNEGEAWVPIEWDWDDPWSTGCPDSGRRGHMFHKGEFVSCRYSLVMKVVRVRSRFVCCQ